MTGTHAALIPPMPPTSLTEEEIAAVSREEVIAYAVFHRVYATLAPERLAAALMLADPTAITQALAESSTQAYNAGFRAGQDHERETLGIEAATVNAKAVAVATGPGKEEMKARRAGA